MSLTVCTLQAQLNIPALKLESTNKILLQSYYSCVDRPAQEDNMTAHSDPTQEAAVQPAAAGVSKDLPPSSDLTIVRLTHSEDVVRHLSSLRTLLQSCVNPEPAKSSIGFRAPLIDAEADEYFMQCARKLGEEPLSFYMFVLLGTNATGSPDPPPVLGTVALNTIPKVTHGHRAEVSKLLVRSDEQRRGYGKLLMAHVEHFAQAELGKDVLILDTSSDLPARGFYNRIGWTEWGTCPEWAEFADGRRTATTFFVKLLK